MGLSTNLIEEFYNTVGKEHDLTLEECKLVCTSPFKLVKEVLSRGLLKDIRLQYFGVFEVVPARVKYSLARLKESYSKGTISEKRFTERREILESYAESESNT